MPNVTKVFGFLSLFAGILMLVGEAWWQQNVLLILGSGSVFLGIYSIVLSTERYVKAEAFTASFGSEVENLDRIMVGLEIDGKAIYLPRDYAGSPRVFIPARDGGPLPDVRADPVFVTGSGSSSMGIHMLPLGHSLLTYLEEELEAKVEDLEPSAVAVMLPPLLTQGLGLAASVEIDEVDLTFTVQSPICSSTCKRGLKACTNVGCPLCSCIAEALSRSLGAPLRLSALQYDLPTDRVSGRLEKIEG